MSERDWADMPFVRIYQSVRSDPKFAKVFGDDRAFAAYVRLLMDADPVHPARASIPAHLSKYAREVLEKAGVLIVTGQTFTISGLAKERASRERHYGPGGTGRKRYDSDSGVRNDSDVVEGPHSDSVLAGGRVGSVGLVGRSSSSLEGGAGGNEPDPYDEAIAWLASKKAWTTSTKVQTELARLVDRKGLQAVLAAMAEVPGAEDAAQFVYGARNLLYPLNGSTVVKADPAEQKRANARAILAAASDEVH